MDNYEIANEQFDRASQHLVVSSAELWSALYYLLSNETKAYVSGKNIEYGSMVFAVGPVIFSLLYQPKSPIISLGYRHMEAIDMQYASIDHATEDITRHLIETIIELYQTAHPVKKNGKTNL